MRPDLSRVGDWYHNYINQVPGDDLLKAFKSESPALLRFFGEIPAELRLHRYAEGKWSIQEVVQHLIDAERIFNYRALRFARKDPTPLHGFDENHYVANARAEARAWDDLVEELKYVRISSELLFKSFNEEELESDGISSNNPMYVRGIGYIIIGHAMHHQRIIRERYLQ
jgi:hypothetical protein